MIELMIIGVIFGAIAIAAVLMPFFKGEGGLLQDAAVSDSKQQLEARRRAILHRWLDEEKQHQTGMLTEREWTLRKSYLSGRYVDVTRRLDWLATVDQQSGSQGATS